ncbi:HAD-superfamily hydrolase [Desulfocucumis palustris]|uniref:HAD-superfamily hydrolase n=1 Tax=Desulfocucumis palustris TaxID=1898651 RepID=A0A2L2XFP9_9FIRM|nr:HAD-IA family hydrolase [Desulfocucumis palustris]GBF34834.1 HAD-superfamily hydrolase [Desulfocucumis palustris]
MALKTLLFDLDGTLMDSIPLITITFRRVFDYYGIPWEKGEVLSTIGLPLREVAERYLPGRAGEFMEKYTLFQKEKQMDYIKLFPGALEALETVKASGYSTGVVTSKRRMPALTGLEATGLNKYMDVVVTVDDVSKPKPNPEPVLRALELLNKKPENAVYVGDSWYDIKAGKGAGVITMGVTWGMASRERLMGEGPEYIVDSFVELMNTLKDIDYKRS